MALSQTTKGDEFSNDLPISNLGDLIILLAMSRIGGEPTPKEVSAFLRRFYIDLDNDYIRGRKKAAEHLYGMEAGVLRKPDEKTIKQVRFLLRALRALERSDRQELPAVMVRKDARIYDVCVCGRRMDSEAVSPTTKNTTGTKKSDGRSPPVPRLYRGTSRGLRALQVRVRKTRGGSPWGRGAIRVPSLSAIDSRQAFMPTRNARGR